MKRKLQQLYWLGILITVLISIITLVLMMWLKVSDTQKDLRHTLNTASAWTLASNDDLQNLAESIADVASPVRVTFLMSHGLVLADSQPEAELSENLLSNPEISEALRGDIGESMFFSVSEGQLFLAAAKRISPQLLLRLSYPIWELSTVILSYAGFLVFWFLILYIIQRRTLSRFANSLVAQMDDVRLVLEGEITAPKAVFPQFQPALNNIAYQAMRMQEDRQEIMRTLNLRQDFVANASHELRSPLTSIMGFAEMLDEGMVDSPEEQALCTQTIRSECSRMLDVIEDILRLSRAERQLTAPSQVDAAAIAREICLSLAPSAARKNITLETEGELTVSATEKDIWEILYNLADNAVRYGRDGGNVMIRFNEDGLTVEDDGIGIAPEHQAHIFEQFYRVDEVRDSSVRGTGLGLSIVQTIVKRCNGEITLESELGKGSRFIIRFNQPEDNE